MKRILFFATLFCSVSVIAADAPLWLRYPAISPDGKTIVFCYKGDIYKMPAAGGTATPVTLSEGHDFMPVWSPDSRSIAFASDRNGNFDIYVIGIEGGTAKRLSFHSANDFPQSFSTDGKKVWFASSRLDQASFIQFPSGLFSELYSVPVTGGKEHQELSIAANDVNFNKTGDVFLFHDRKGYEDNWRKHHQSSVARDVWMYETKGKKFTQLTDFAGEDRNAVWSSDEKSIYFLSEKSGNFNVWKMTAGNVAEQVQVSKFDKNPVRFLTLSDNDLMCYSYNGEVYTQIAGGEPQKIAVRIETDERYADERLEIFKDGVTDMDVSPNGKEVAFVVRGEVFVTSMEGGFTRRITNTPEQERSVDFSPDGRSILYASERNNLWGLYRTSLVRKEEAYFYHSTLLKEETILAGPGEAFQPEFSPDGTEVAYIGDRTAVKVIHLKTKKIRVILPADKNYSYSDGDQSFEWSPDGKYLLVHFLQDNQWRQEVGLVDAEGKGPVTDLTQSGFSNGGGKWSINGQMITWQSNRHGMKNIASHGNQVDVYGLFLTKAAFERFKMSKEEYELLTAKETKEKEKDKTADSLKKVPVKIELKNIQDRKVRLTIHSSNMGEAIVSPDGEKLYYLCAFEGGYDLWVNKFRDHETKLFMKLNAGGARALRFDREGKNLFLLADGKMYKIDLEKNEKKEIGFNAEMNLNTTAERAYLFDHIWRQVSDKFYVTDLQRTDWKYYKENYAKFLPYINNNRDFSEMMSEMLGELNASHTGCMYYPRMKNPDETASLGAFFDENYLGNGLKIVEVMDKGPLANEGSQIKAGTIIEKIDGVAINDENNVYQLLNRKAGKYTLLSLYDESSKKRWEETVKPINQGQVGQLLYLRWVASMQEMTEKLSGGKLGYMHVRGMNDESYREFYDQVMGKYANKKALIVDTRFNGGGWLHDDLASFLSGKKYMDFVPRERKIGSDPAEKWTKPSVVMISEGNYSDAHMFPVAYKALGIGKLVGMPVPGTGTAVWWENLQDPTLIFGIPEVGVVDMNGKYFENNQLEPDIKVRNEYGPMLEGKDQQLQEAIKTLMAE